MNAQTEAMLVTDGASEFPMSAPVSKTPNATTLNLHTVDGIIGAIVWGVVFGGGVVVALAAGFYHTYMNVFGG